MTGEILMIISYVLIAMFLVSFILKAIKMASLPMHLRWELSPVPHEKGKGHYGGSYLEEFEWWTKPREKSLIAEAVYMFKEIFYLKGVKEHKFNLWLFSFPFHFGMYVLTAAVVLTFLSAILPESLVPAGSGAFIEIVAAIGFLLAILGTLGLFIRRLADPGMRNYSTAGTVFNLIFLLALFVSGIIALFNVPSFFAEMNQYAKLVMFADTSVSLSGIIVLHCILNLVFLAYLPYTRMVHFLAKYFTYHDVRWNDQPIAGNAKMEKDVAELVSQPVSWSAPHLNADGKKNWLDIASDGGKK